MITSWEIPHPPKHWSTFRLQMVPYPYLIAVDFHTVATKVDNYREFLLAAADCDLWHRPIFPRGAILEPTQS